MPKPISARMGVAKPELSISCKCGVAVDRASLACWVAVDRASVAWRYIVQVSLNLSALEQTPLHAAMEAVREEAAALRVVGLVPLRALTAAARFYARREGLLLLETHDLLALAVARLGLNQLAPFDPK
ncbi:Formimidoyltransferase-cyclodeaminase [Gryllus bimaculatus]|nr:Formimidoyltransferase-cyclodeaminase [Gryllus bimaculatus]